MVPKLESIDMAYDENLADRTRAVLPDDAIAERKMFGGLAFMMSGHMICGITGDALMLRLGAEGGDAALAEPHVRPMEMTGRPMRGMVLVDPSGVETDEALADWVGRARAFVETLPPKR